MTVTQFQGNQDLVLRQLGKQMRMAVPIALGASEAIELADKVRALSVEQVEALGEALLDFHGVEDLVAWLGKE